MGGTPADPDRGVEEGAEEGDDPEIGAEEGLGSVSMYDSKPIILNRSENPKSCTLRECSF